MPAGKKAALVEAFAKAQREHGRPQIAMVEAVSDAVSVEANYRTVDPSRLTVAQLK